MLRYTLQNTLGVSRYLAKYDNKHPVKTIYKVDKIDILTDLDLNAWNKGSKTFINVPCVWLLGSVEKRFHAELIWPKLVVLLLWSSKKYYYLLKIE